MTRARELADLLTGGQTIATDDNTTQLTLKSTDADSSTGPVLDLVRDSASPADGDAIGKLAYIADNDAGEATTYSSAFTTLRDASDGAEDGQVINYVITGGSLVDHLRMGRGSAGGQSEVVINEGSADIDFRVESNGNANMLVVDGGNDKVGIGTNSPTQSLDVSGSGNQSIAITSTDSGDTSINFADTDNNIGKLTYAHSTNTMVFRTNDAERMRINSAGNLLLGQTATTQPGIGNTTAGLGINATGRIFSSVDGAWSFFNRNNDNGQVIGFGRDGTAVGGISVTTSNTSFNTSSDYRLKENVADMTGAIDRVKALAPKRFNFIVDADTTVDGFLAHEAQAVVPEAVTGTKDEVDDDDNAVMQGIDQSKLVPLLTGALKEAIAKIETLETKVAALEAE